MNHAPLPELGPANDQSIEQAKMRLKVCAKANFFKHAIKTSIGGLGDSFLDLAHAHETLGYQTQDPGLMLAINAHLWGALFSIIRFGTTSQKQRWLEPLLSGKIIGGHAITEPQAGSDIQLMTTTFQETDKGFILNGHKRYITNTPIAKVMIVYAKQINQKQISAFLIEPTDSGARFEKSPTVSGCATATMGDVILSNCEIPHAKLLGKRGAGSNMIQLALERERAFIFSGITGIMKWQLAQVIQYTKQRKNGSGRLANHQAISHTLADMCLRLDTSRLWIERCAQLLDDGKRITLVSAQAKLYASEAFLQSTLDASHLMGAAGLNDPFTTLVRDAMAGRLMSGSSEIQRNIIAAMMGLPMTTHN